MPLNVRNKCLQLNNVMIRKIPINCFSIIIGAILTLSCIAFLVNHFIYHFPGNTFFPENFMTIPFVLLFLNIGISILFEPNSMARKIGKELIYFVLIMSLIAFATDAIQLTPFEPIDNYILPFEEFFHIDMPKILSWTNEHQHFKLILGLSYDSLVLQMSIIPLVVILCGKFEIIHDYYFLLLSTLLFGFIFYYFWPTTAPASIIHSPFFSPEQHATGLKFHQIHQHIVPTTNEGGLIALPSFHAIWAILCIYLVKDWPIIRVTLVIVNTALISSCVLLGWHYLIDIIAAFLLTWFCFYLLKRCNHAADITRHVKT